MFYSIDKGVFALAECLDLPQYVSITFVFNVVKQRVLCTMMLFVTQVGLWKGRVDRQCIERMKNFQNPPLLVGQVMEMVMTLIGKRLPSQRLEFRPESYPTRDGESGRFSSSSSSTKFTTKKSKCEHTFYLSIVPHSGSRISSCAANGHDHHPDLVKKAEYVFPVNLKFCRNNHSLSGNDLPLNICDRNCI